MTSKYSMSSLLPGQGGASWLPDPSGRFDQRYWDGSGWTVAVMRDGEVLSDSGTLPEGVPESAVMPSVRPPPAASGPSYVAAASPGDRYTSLSPEEARRRVGQMLQTKGWSVTGPGPGRFDVTLSVPGYVNPFMLLIYLMMLILPGIIYAKVKGRRTVVRASMTFVPADGGTRIAMQGSTDALLRLGPIMVMLPW